MVTSELVKNDWAADAAFADVPRWNPDIDRVLSQGVVAWTGVCKGKVMA